MASNKTANLNLNIWAEMDFFKRDELNNNFTKIDAKAKENSDKIGDLSQSSEKAGLSGWHRDFLFNRNKKITYIGDSTSDSATQASNIWNELTNTYTKSGELLEGITFTNRALNGSKIRTFLNNEHPQGKNLSDAIADQADMYILSYGINDVRLGATSQEQLTQYLDSVVKELLKNTKGYILLRIPNSLASDDPTNTGWLTPLSAAQTYTDILWNTYMSFRNKYPRVDVLDMQTLLFGRTSKKVADSNGLMTDVLHPTADGYKKIAGVIATYIGVKIPLRGDLLSNAITQNPLKPYLIYPRALENGSYREIVRGSFKAMGSGYVDFYPPLDALYEIQQGDIICIGDKLAYDITGTPYNMTTYCRIADQTFANYERNDGGVVRIFRKNGNANLSFTTKNTNVNAKTIGSHFVDRGLTFSNITGSLDRLLVNNAVNIKVSLQKGNNAPLEIATMRSSNNNRFLGYITWNTTNFPNSKCSLNKGDLLIVECISISPNDYTGDLGIGLYLF